MAEPIIPPRTYYTIFGALIVLTVSTVGVASLPLGPLHTVAGLAIAVAKAALVLLFFMHLIYSTRLTWVVALSGLLWLAILLTYTLSDYMTRGWLPGPGH